MGKVYTELEWKQRIEDKFPNKFDFRDWNFVDSKTKVTLYCKDCGEIINSTPNALINDSKYGCMGCYNKNRYKDSVDPILKLLEKYGDTFEVLEYRGTKNKSIIRCKVCGKVSEKSISLLLNNYHGKYICEVCTKEYLRTQSMESYKQKIYDKFGDKFIIDWSTFKTAKSKMAIKCTVCGNIFKGTADGFVDSVYGCTKCQALHHAISLKEFKEKLNSRFDSEITLVDNTYSIAKNPATFICKTHGKFTLNGARSIFKNVKGCPLCSGSKGELYITEYLNSHNIKFVSQFRIEDPSFLNRNYILVDFYLPNYNTFIEYNGIQHYIPIEYFGGELQLKELLLRDKELDKYAKDKNINILWIKYTDNIEDILNGFFKKLLPTSL